MSYQVLFSKKALENLQGIDKKQTDIILRWIGNHLQGTDNPRQWGHALKGKGRIFWRYRIGRFRFLADIGDKELVILVIKVGHRSSIYRA